MNAPKAAEKERVRVTMEAVRPRKAQAPTGSGPRTRPAMVERKMERSCQAWSETSAGRGTKKRTARPMAMEIASGNGLAPDRGTGVGFGGGEEGEEAQMGGRRRCGLGEGKWGRDRERRVGRELGAR